MHYLCTCSKLLTKALPLCRKLYWTWLNYKEKPHCLTYIIISMFEEKAGALAGKIWEALNEGGKLSGKELKKATKIRAEKDLYLGMGWLLREGKLEVAETEKDIEVSLK